MSRNLLHKSKIERFQIWLATMKIEFRSVDIDYQVMQIKWKNQWMSVFYRDHMPEHYSVDRRLDPLVKMFIDSRR